MSLKSWIGALEDAEGSWLEFASWSFFGYGQEPCLDLPWSFDHTQISESSDADSLESVQLRSRVRSVLNYHFRAGRVGRVWVGSGPKLKTVIAQLRLSRSIPSNIKNKMKNCQLKIWNEIKLNYACFWLSPSLCQSNFSLLSLGFSFQIWKHATKDQNYSDRVKGSTPNL